MAFSFSPKIVTDGLVLALDAANPRSYVSGSTTITDLTSNFSLGTLYNGPTYSSQNLGSIVIDGTDDYISGSVIFNPSFSADFWFTATSLANWSQTFSLGLNNVGSGWGDFTFHSTSNGSIYCGTTVTSRFEPTDSGCGAGSIVVNSPVNITFTFSSGSGSGTAKLYKNGSLLGTKTLTNPANPDLKSQYKIGTTPPTNPGFMRFHAFKMYNRVISDSEVLQNYNATKSRFNLT